MCNYELLAIDEGVTDADVLQQVDVAIARLSPLARLPYMLVTSQGSFLDDQEISPALRGEILRRLAAAGLKTLSTESEARYCLDSERLLEIKRNFPGRFSVGIGLEAADEVIRNVVINKGLPERTLIAATDALRSHGIGFYFYVTLGKPFLSLDEDLEDALNAVRLSQELGAFMTVIEMINIQPHTLTAKLWEQGDYRTPWLWSAIALLERLPSDLRSTVSIKGFDADTEPLPKDLPSNCCKCDAIVKSALNRWNLHRDDSAYDALAALDCTCKDQWREEGRARSTVDIVERVRSKLTNLNVKMTAGAE